MTIDKTSLFNVLSGRFARNVMFWVLFGALNIFINTYGTADFFQKFTLSQIVMLFTSRLMFYGPIVYFNNLFLIPQLFERGKHLWYTIAIVGFATLQLFYIKYTLIYVFMRFAPDLLSFDPSEEPPVVYLLTTVAFILGFSMAKFAADHFDRIKKDEELKQQRLEGELSSLRSQINPHFLFNALNTIYGLSIKEDQQTPAAIMKLSTILRYNLYECNTGNVSLEKEIHYLENFVSFGKLRQRANASIKLSIKGELQNKQIAPLILIPFVENAFKHGLDSNIESPWMEIEISVDGNAFMFKCSNSSSQSKSVSRTDSGIGLLNVQRRLQLLYENKHQLTLTDNKDAYTVLLKLDLDD